MWKKWSQNGFNFQRLAWEVWEVLFVLSMFLTCGQTYLPLENFQCLHYFPHPLSLSLRSVVTFERKMKKVYFLGRFPRLEILKVFDSLVRCYSFRQLRPQGDFQQIGLIIPNSCWFVERFTWCFLKIVDVDLNHYLWEYLEEGSKTDRPKKVVNLWGVKMVIK